MAGLCQAAAHLLRQAEAPVAASEVNPARVTGMTRATWGSCARRISASVLAAVACQQRVARQQRVAPGAQ